MTKFFANIRRMIFAGRIEREICNRIAEQIHGIKDHGYPFSSEEELLKAAVQGNRDAKLQIETIERQADDMGKAYGEAFRYIMYRDLNARLRQYALLAKRRVLPKTCDSRLIATSA